MNGKSKKQKSEKPVKQNNAVYVTSLPLDADKEEVADVFKKCGMLAESLEDNEARVKLYTDEYGNFKGDALVGMHPLRYERQTFIDNVSQSTTARSPWVLPSTSSTEQTSALERRGRWASLWLIRATKRRRTSL